MTEKNELAISVDIDAPPARVWSVMSDGERWPEWTASVTSVKLLDAGPLRIGSRALIKQPKFPPALWRVTELIDGRSFTWASGGPGVRVFGQHSVEPGGTGSRARLSVRYEGIMARVLVWLTRRITERYLAMEAAGLKKRSESADA